MTTCHPPEPIGPPEAADPEANPVAFLLRWESFGATIDVISLSDESVTLSLCRCDGGEEAQRLVSTDPDVVSWIRAREINR